MMTTETMGAAMASLGDQAWQIIQAAVPQADRATGCLYFATAAAAALGTGWSFRAGGAMLGSSGVTGWGLSVNPRERQYFVTADQQVDPGDGGYCGHCWVQAVSPVYQPIVDLHEGYYGPGQQADKLIIYHAIPSLGRSIKRHHAAALTAVARRARGDKVFVAAVHLAAQQAREVTLQALCSRHQ